MTNVSILSLSLSLCEKTGCFGWVTWGMLLYIATDQLLWLLTLSYIQGKFDFISFLLPSPLFSSLLFSSHCESQRWVNPCWRPLASGKPNPSHPPSSSSSLFIKNPSCNQVFASGSLLFLFYSPARICTIATEQNSYIFIYVQCKMNAHLFMEQTFRTLTSD